MMTKRSRGSAELDVITSPASQMVDGSSAAAAARPVGIFKAGLAKPRLHEICKLNHWCAPVFECFKEEGPAHQMLFTYKVIVKIEEASSSRTILECRGNPQSKKKTAAENAAEGAIWYLERSGYSLC